MKKDRRQFLRLASAATGTLAAGSLLACGGSDAGGVPDAFVDPPDAALDGDGSVLCNPTTNDALGPFFETGAPMRMKIAEDTEPGDRLVMTGTVVGVDCVTPIEGALLDLWQADKDGNYHDAGTEFRLRGQILTGSDGRFMVDTIRPGFYLIGTDSWRPAHLHFMVAKPGYRTLTTQLYFSGDPFLPPNDGCTTCGSDDPLRVVDLSGDAGSGWTGDFTIILGQV